VPPLFPADAADANRRDRAHAWYAAYYEAIYRYTYMKMQNNDEAGIAASDAFVRMMQNADKLAALSDDEVRRRLFEKIQLCTEQVVWGRPILAKQLDQIKKATWGIPVDCLPCGYPPYNCYLSMRKRGIFDEAEWGIQGFCDLSVVFLVLHGFLCLWEGNTDQRDNQYDNGGRFDI